MAKKYWGKYWYSKIPKSRRKGLTPKTTTWYDWKERTKTRKGDKMERKSKKIAFEKTCKRVKFQVRETGRNWTIFYKEKNKPFKRIQSVADLKLAKQIIQNQRECRR